MRTTQTGNTLRNLKNIYNNLLRGYALHNKLCINTQGNLNCASMKCLNKMLNFFIYYFFVYYSKVLLL